MGSDNLLKSLSFLWIALFLYVVFHFVTYTQIAKDISHKNEKTEQQVQKEAPQQQPRKEVSQLRASPHKDKTTPRASHQEPRRELSFLESFPVAPEFPGFPKDGMEWFDHYSKQQKKLITPEMRTQLLEEFKNKEQREMFEFLCDKGFMDHCNMAAQMQSYPMDPKNMTEEEQDLWAKKFELDYRACEKMGIQSCRQIFYSSHLFTETQMKKFNSLLKSLCQSRWGGACELLADLFNKEGKVKKAISLAKKTCEELGFCEMIGRLLITSNPDESAHYMYKDCMNNKYKCWNFVKDFPDHPKIGVAVKILRELCKKERSQGYSDCILLAEYYEGTNQLGARKDILEYSCKRDNPTACVNLGFLYLKKQNNNLAYSYFDEACDNEFEQYREPSGDNDFCGQVSHRDLKLSDYSRYKLYPAYSL